MMVHYFKNILNFCEIDTQKKTYIKKSKYWDAFIKYMHECDWGRVYFLMKCFSITAAISFEINDH